jgi:uncharacterized membrane protein YphA (DoxX/SURF4 family)
VSTPSTVGRVCIGVAAAGTGCMQVVNAGFVRLVAWPAAWRPAQEVAAIAAGVVLVIAGGALVANRFARQAALVLGLLWGAALLLRVPEVLANPGAGYVWTNPAKILALIGGALLLAGGRARVPIIAAAMLAAFLLLGGAQHFVYAAFVDTLVPAWIPPAQRFWTLFTAVALLAGGVGVLVPATRRLAGLLVGVMIFLWVVLLHVPRSVEMKSAFELAGVFEALALGGVAWLVAGTVTGVGNLRPET